MSKPQHLVFGAGLIGGFLAGALISRGFETSVLARETAREKFKNGISLSDYLNNNAQVAPPNFISAVDENDLNRKSEYAVIWLTIKCTAIENSIASLTQLMSPKTILICCQNGLGSDLPLRNAFPNNTVLTAIAGYNVAEPKPGYFHRSTEGKLVVQENLQSLSLVEQLDCALLPSRTSENIVAEQWAKLQFNLANPVNALSDIPVKTMTEDREFRKIIASLMTEMLLVSDAMGLKLPKFTSLPGHWVPYILRLPNFIFKMLAQKMLAIDPTARLSMWWDLSNKKPTEIDYLNGAVVAQAAKLGIECPYNQRILCLIKEVEAGVREIGITAAELKEKLQIT